MKRRAAELNVNHASHHKAVAADPLDAKRDILRLESELSGGQVKLNNVVHLLDYCKVWTCFNMKFVLRSEFLIGCHYPQFTDLVQSIQKTSFSE